VALCNVIGNRNFLLFYFRVFLLSIGGVIEGEHPKLKKVISVHALGSSLGFPHGVIDPIEVTFSLHKLIEIL
jgi:hypothetical protein